MKAKLDPRMLRRPRPGLGLHTYEQTRSLTTWQLVVLLWVGQVVCFYSVLMFLQDWSMRVHEIENFGTADLHLGRWLGAAAVFIVGVFFAHTPVIAFWRKWKAWHET